MHRYLLHNGEIRETSERLLSPGQVGYLNGWGVFSTIRVYDGVLFAWERHWARMKTDAARLRVPFPESAEALLADLHRLVEANQAWNATLRVMIERNRGGMFEDPAIPREFDVVAFTREVTAWGEGLRLGLVSNGRHAASEFAGAKILAWSENLARYEKAHEQGFDEVVLLNERGEVSECTSANIFAVHRERVLTPPLASGCLPGVTRAILLEEIRVPGIQVCEEAMLPASLETADEVFVTSSTRELLPVISVEGLKIRQGREVRDRLQSAFTAYVKSYTAARRRPAAVSQ
ncbi:MAG TPA: aminotransferase class IV [Bryobacteraceae bacterium]|nr:aminotransferase class IV [Bryobacteraceae bacterium]